MKGRLERDSNRLIGIATDVTELHLAEQRLREIDERYRSLMDSAPLAIVLQQEGRIRYANEAAARLFKAPSPRDLAGREMLDLIAEESRALVQERESRLATERSVEMAEEWLLALDGSRIRAEVTAAVITLDGKPAVQCVVKDVTEQAAIRQQFQDRENERRQILEGLPFGIVVVNRGGGRCFASQRAHEMLGPALQRYLDLDGRAPLSGAYIAGTDRPYPLSKMPLTRALKGEPSHVDDLEIRRPEGSTYLLVSGTPIFCPQGTVTKAIVTFYDISAKQEAERLLKESEEKFSQAFTHALYAMAIAHPAGKFIDVNESMCQMLGYQREEILQLHLLDIIHPDDLETASDTLLDLIKGDADGDHHVKKYMRKDGKTLWVETAISIARRDGERPVAFIVHMQDITARIEAEEALRDQAELLDLASDSIIVRDLSSKIVFWNRGAEATYGWTADEAVGKVSHELLATVFPGHPKEIDATLLAEGAWQGELSHARCDGARIAVSSRQVLHRDAEGRAKAFLEINTDITEQREAREQLRRLALIDELTGLGNRRSFMTLGAHEITRANRLGTPLALVFVDINGMKHINDAYGHAAGDQAVIAVADAFRAVFRDSDITARMGGDEFCILMPETTMEAGQIAKSRLLRRLEAHNAASEAPFEVTASVGVALREPGSDETIEALLQRADEAMYVEKRHADEDKPRLLVAEDDASIQSLISVVLGDAYDVMAVGSGSEALELLEFRRIDGVLIDKGLPDMSGIRVVERLRSDRSFVSTPVIMLTGDSSTDLQIESFKAGVDDYVVKPFAPEVLRARVERAMAAARKGQPKKD
jgi:diguanylate cyclase (GGDEF)-like protein/PAS domain S-box-containing protein